MAKKDELVKVETGSLAVPDYLAEESGHAGGENIGRDDVVLPRLAVCQSTSPQRDRNKAVYITGLEEGDLFNTVTKEIYPSKTSLIPLKYLKSRIYFKPLKDGGGILCQSRNGINGGVLSPASCASCEHSQFKDDGKPSCDLFMNMVSLLLPPAVESPQLVVFSFKSMALKTAKSWLTLLQARNKPFFTQVYDVHTLGVSNSKGSFYTPIVDFSRWVSPEELKRAKEEFEYLKEKDIATDSDEPEAASQVHDAEIAF